MFLDQKLYDRRREVAALNTAFWDLLTQRFNKPQNHTPGDHYQLLNDPDDPTEFSETLSTAGVDQQRPRTLQEEMLETTFFNKGSTLSFICRPPGTPVNHSVEQLAQHLERHHVLSNSVFKRNTKIHKSRRPNPASSSPKLYTPSMLQSTLLVYATLLHGAKPLITPTGRPPEEKEESSLLIGKTEGIQQQMIKGKIVSNW